MMTARSLSAEVGAPSGFDADELTEALKEKRLAVFPLDVCQFPGQEFPLHIFEPRYKIMFSSIMGEDKKPPKDMLTDGVFGMVCMKADAQLPAGIGETEWKSYNVGTVVQILNKMILDNGNLLITCKARARIDVTAPQRDLLGYWTAQAEVLPPIDPAEHHENAESAMDQCRRVYQDFLALQVLGHTDDEKSDILDVMQANGGNCVELGDWLAARLPVSNASKQNLLETNDPIWRLLKIANSFRKLVDMYASIEAEPMDETARGEDGDGAGDDGTASGEDPDTDGGSKKE